VQSDYGASLASISQRTPLSSVAAEAQPPTASDVTRSPAVSSFPGIFPAASSVSDKLIIRIMRVASRCFFSHPVIIMTNGALGSGTDVTRARPVSGQPADARAADRVTSNDGMTAILNAICFDCSLMFFFIERRSTLPGSK